ncbi:MAG: aminotransferase class V-fold PLP-dependent enzyme [Bacteroidota bacterium]
MSRGVPVSAPGRFGRAMLAEWRLDPGITYLNHGTVGAPPRRALEAQEAIRGEIELEPARFLLRELSEIAVGGPRAEPPRLRAAAERVAAFLGAAGKDLVFVDNATTAVNAVLRSLPFGPGDEIVIADHAYGAIRLAASFRAEETGAVVRDVAIPGPPYESGAIEAAYAEAISPRARLLIVDHVTSESALLLPVEAIVARCRAAGVPVLVDGAHGPGAVPVDVRAIGADWYAANLHKWAFAPRSCGVLWSAPARQAGLHSPVISWGLGRGFTAEFDWVGTRDPSAWLAAPAGIDWMEELGADAVRGHNRTLARQAAELLTDRWGTARPAPDAMIGPMATVPMPERLGAEPEDAARVRDRLLFDHRIEVQLHAWRGRLWTRVSAQIYNELGDVERLAEAVSNLSG